jgi:LysM repeat protein
MNTMIGPNYQDVGAGVASDGNSTYYTLDVGYIAGSGSSSGSGSTGSGATAAPGVAPATAVAFFPVLVATPGPDGSVVHTVQSGQTLWVIAATYKIQLADLLALNGMTDNSYIFPGDQLIIQPPQARTGPAATQAQDSGQPTPTRSPTRTSVPQATEAVALLQATQAAVANAPPDSPPISPALPALPSGKDLLLGLIVLLVLGGLGLMVVGNLLDRRGGAAD